MHWKTCEVFKRMIMAMMMMMMNQRVSDSQGSDKIIGGGVEGSLVDHRQDHKEVACTTGMRIVRMARVMRMKVRRGRVITTMKITKMIRIVAGPGSQES